MAWRCQCGERAAEHLKDLCARIASVEVIRRGKSLYVCEDCVLSSDKKVRDL